MNIAKDSCLGFGLDRFLYMQYLPIVCNLVSPPEKKGKQQRLLYILRSLLGDASFSQARAVVLKIVLEIFSAIDPVTNNKGVGAFKLICFRQSSFTADKTFGSIQNLFGVNLMVVLYLDSIATN